MSDRAKRWLWIGVRFAISAGALTYVITQTSFPDLVANVRGLRLGVLALAFGVYQVGMLLWAFRWWMLLRGHNLDTPYLTLLRLVYTARFFNTFLPTSLGGEVARTVEITYEEGHPTRQVGVVVLEQVLSIASLLAIALVSIIFNPGLLRPSITRPVLIVSVIGLAAIVALLEGSVPRRVEPLYRKLPGAEIIDRLLETITDLPVGALLRSLTVAFVFQLSTVTLHFTAARANRINLGWHYFAVFNPVVGLSFVVPTLQGLGVREGLYTWLLKNVGVAESKAVTLGLTIYALALVTGLIGGLVNLLTSVEDIVEEGEEDSGMSAN
jgi:uncharacterized membrane protein YbhN (UPF0104 family)